MPNPHPVNPVVDDAAMLGAGVLGIFKIKVNVGNWSTDLARAS
jgi:hypothetical protein